MRQIIKNQSGFTLVELLMTIFISIIIVVGATGIYVYSTKAQQTTLKLNVVAQDTQFLFDTISRKVREGNIDYDFYGENWDADNLLDIDINNDAIPDEIFDKDILAIYNQTQLNWFVGGENYYYKGALITKQGDSVAVCFCPENRCELSCSPFIPLTTDSLKITDLEFKISPASSPFGLAYGLSGLEQPHMTMRIELEGAGEKMSIQQTVPQRFIERQ